MGTSVISPSSEDNIQQGEEVINEMMSSDYNKYKYDPYALPRSEAPSLSQDKDTDIRIIKGRKTKLKPLDFTPKLPTLTDSNVSGEKDGNMKLDGEEKLTQDVDKKKKTKK